MSEDIPICPDWWPRLLWNLHFQLRPKRPIPGGDPIGPVNYPPAVDDIMAGLHIHAMSYLMLDTDAAQEIRNVAERQLTNAVQNLHRRHQEAINKTTNAGRPTG